MRFPKRKQGTNLANDVVDRALMMVDGLENALKSVEAVTELQRWEDEYRIDRPYQKLDLPIGELQYGEGSEEHGDWSPYHRHDIPRRPREHLQHIRAK